MPKIVVLENDALVAKGVSLVIEKDRDNNLMFVAQDSTKLLEYIEKNRNGIDIAILDIELNEGQRTGLDVAEIIRDSHPHIKILFLTNYKRCEYIIPVFGKYEGYLFKWVHPDEFRKAIREITTAGRGTYYSQDVIKFYYDCIQGLDEKPKLSKELLDTLVLVAQGHTNWEIAEQLSSPEKKLNENIIRERRRRLRYLLSAKNSPHMVAKAFMFDLLTVDQIK